MKVKFLPLVIVAGSLMFATSCKKGCTDPKALNYDSKAKKDNGVCEYPEPEEPTYEVPATYTFTDKDGNNTVDFTGQKQRMDMLSEMATYMKSANTAGTAVDATTLKNMYANTGYTWADANGLGLNNTTKNLKDKTGYSLANGSPDTGIQTMFEKYIDSIATISATTTTGNEDGSAGNGGVWPNDGSKGPYLMSGAGIEYMQLIEKGLMASVFMSQTTVHYLEVVKTADNSSAVDAAGGKYYTQMEHYWDEAYGYFTSSTDYPTTGTDRFWGKYASSRESVLSSATKIAEAFRKGRAAISNQDYETRDAQITIIRDEMQKVCAATAISYLNQAKDNLTNNTSRNHVLSEAYAFVDGLRYGYNAINSVGITKSDIDTALGHIGTDFNNVTLAGLNNAIDVIASKTGLESVKDQL